MQLQQYCQWGLTVHIAMGNLQLMLLSGRGQRTQQAVQQAAEVAARASSAGRVALGRGRDRPLDAAPPESSESAPRCRNGIEGILSVGLSCLLFNCFITPCSNNKVCAASLFCNRCRPANALCCWWQLATICRSMMAAAVHQGLTNRGGRWRSS